MPAIHRTRSSASRSGHSSCSAWPPSYTSTRRSGARRAFNHSSVRGVSMIRSAAKNFRYVAVVVNPERYAGLAHEMQAHEGAIPFTTRFRLAQEAYATTARYDEVLSDYLRRCEPPEE